MLPNGCKAARSGLAEGLLRDRGRTLPRVGLLLSGIALLVAALHCLVASAMPSYLVHCCRI